MNSSGNVTNPNESIWTDFHEYGCPPFTEADRIAKMFSLSVILVISLFGNLLVIIVVYRNRNLRRTINFFILNIAVSDIFIPVVAIPKALVELARGDVAWLLEGPFGEFMCKMVHFLTDISSAVSIMSLIFMTVDRFLAVVFPLRVTLMNAKRRYALLALTWIISMGFCSPYFYAFQVIPYEGQRQYCILSWSSIPDTHTKATKIYGMLLSICFLIIPFIVLTVLYTIILIKTKTPDFIQNKYSTASRARQKTSKRLTLMSFLIVFIFGLCWGPYNIILFLLTFVWDWREPAFCAWGSIIFVVQFLCYFNTAINPCVYFIFIKNFRRGLKNQLTTRSRSRMESRRNKLNSETMLCSVQNNTVRNALNMSVTECETCL